MLASVLHIGWVAEFLSKPIVTGFVLGLTILVIIGELPNILGIPVPPRRRAGSGSRTSSPDWTTSSRRPSVVGISALAVMFVGREAGPARCPGRW